MKNIYCMIIGDIVDSQLISQNERFEIQESLKSALERINFSYDKYICSRFGVTLGDELQGGLYSVYPLFEILDKIKRSIQPYKIRFGIGIDTLNTEVMYNQPLETDGLAYHLARRAINELKEIETWEYGYLIKSSLVEDDIFNQTLRLADCISQNWSDVQREYIEQVQLNRKMDLSLIAWKKGVNVSSVSRAIAKSNYRVVQEALEHIKDDLYVRLSIGEKQDEFLSAYNSACVLVDDDKLEVALKVLNKYTEDICEEQLKNYYMLLAIIYDRKNDPVNAIKYAQKVLFYLDNKYRCRIVGILNILGISYTNLGDYRAAQTALKTAMDMLEFEDRVESWIAYTMKNLAQLELRLGEYELAEEQLHKLKEYIDEHLSDEKKIRIELQSNMGELYYKNKRYRLSMEAYTEAIKSAEICFGKKDSMVEKLRTDLGKVVSSLLNDETDVVLKEEMPTDY